MTILVNNPVQNTLIFIGILVFVLTFFRQPQEKRTLSKSVTQELKGLAILLVIFGHIGYFLSTDHQFLFPLSVIAGVGVDLFLFLSGYGLTVSKLQNENKERGLPEETIWEFYKKRLPGLFIPFWIALGIFVGLDFLILGISYPLPTLLRAVFGIFTTANIYTDINSPLWYFTFIFVCYLLYPLFFSKRNTYISALAILALTYALVSANCESLWGVIGLYKAHLLAFPLGMFFASMFNQSNLIGKVQNSHIFKNALEVYKRFEYVVFPVCILLLLTAISYFSIYSGVGKGTTTEQGISILIGALILLFFVYKKTEFKLLSLFGLYSYEIYLIHWPLLYRYDVFYPYLPAWLATVCFLVVFIACGWVLKKITNSILRRI